MNVIGKINIRPGDLAADRRRDLVSGYYTRLRNKTGPQAGPVGVALDAIGAAIASDGPTVDVDLSALDRPRMLRSLTLTVDNVARELPNSEALKRFAAAVEEAYAEANPDATALRDL